MKGVEKIEHTLHNLASPTRGHTFWGLLAVLAVAALLIWASHGEWLRAPNDVMFSKSSDGLKNYMTSAWHVQQDSGYVHYSGMDYPFGDHVLFTDNQPILCAGIKWWSKNVSDVRGDVVGIIHLTLVLSIIFGAGVIYLLLRKLHLPVWYAGLSAMGIAFLSPQYNRFDGHFGLSHIWVLPMLLLLLCRYEERQSRRYQSLLIGILIWFSAQLHFYYLGVLYPVSNPARFFLAQYLDPNKPHDRHDRAALCRFECLDALVGLLSRQTRLSLRIHGLYRPLGRGFSPVYFFPDAPVDRPLYHEDQRNGFRGGGIRRLVCIYFYALADLQAAFSLV